MSDSSDEITLSIGQHLRQEREGRGIPLEQAAQTTRIRFRYLQALEADDLSVFPSLAQARGFLRAYAVYLHLDPAPMLVALGGEIPTLPLPAPTAPPPPTPGTESAPAPADAIFAEIGQKLCRQRELLGLSCDDVERQTHLRIHYLQALEKGKLDDLPSPVQGRGMLKNYATFLGLDADALLLRFAEGLQTRLNTRRQEESPRRPRRSDQPARNPSTLRRLLSMELVFGSALVLFLISLAVWGLFRISAMSAAQTPSVTAPSVADVLAPTATPTLSPTPFSTPSTPLPVNELPVVQDTPGGAQGNPAGEPSTSETAATTPDASSAAVQVHVVVRQRAWMRVVSDGKVAFEGRVVPGAAYTFTGSEAIELITGNGAALQVFYNQRDLGVLGAFGEVVQRIFTVTGIVLPTATITPTPPPPTATATPGLTPTLETPLPPTP